MNICPFANRNQAPLIVESCLFFTQIFLMNLQKIWQSVYLNVVFYENPNKGLCTNYTTLLCRLQITSHFREGGGRRICDIPNTKFLFLWKICDNGGRRGSKKSFVLHDVICKWLRMRRFEEFVTVQTQQVGMGVQKNSFFS